MIKVDINENERLPYNLKIQGEQYIPISVIEGIKAEIEQIRKNALGFSNWHYAKGLEKAWEIIDRHIKEYKE